MLVPPEQRNGSQALLKEALEEKAGRGKEATPLPTHTWEGQHRQTCVRGRKPLAVPGAQEGSVSVDNATGPSWGVKSGCFRACKTRAGPAPTEKGTVCNCLQVSHIIDAGRDL